MSWTTVSRVVTILYIFFGLVFIFSIINDGVQECLKQIEKKAAEGPELRQVSRLSLPLPPPS
jgi:hypothetical protein